MMNTDLERSSTRVYYAVALSLRESRCACDILHEVVRLQVVGGCAEQPVALHKGDKGIELLRQCVTKKSRIFCIFSPVSRGHCVRAVFLEPDTWTLALLKEAVRCGAMTPETIAEFHPVYHNIQ